MSDSEEPSDEEQRLIKEIDKEIEKVKYFMEEIDELIEIQDYSEMEIVNKRAVKIITKLSDLISQTEELKIERGLSPRTVRQWRKDIKSKYAASVSENERLRKCLDDREEEITRQKEDLKREQQLEDERRLYVLREKQQERERELWKEKLEAELLVAEKKLEMAKTAVSSTTKLRKLKIMYRSNRSFNMTPPPLPLATPRAFDFFENYCSNSLLPGPKCHSNAPH